NNGNAAGTWNVTVVNPDGQSSNTVNFTVTATIPAPAISGLSPASYPASGNPQTMLINGSNFQNGATLTFHDPQGNTYAAPGASSHSLRDALPMFNNGNAAGTWNVTVVNPDGQSSNTVNFTVTAATPAPSISGLSPTSYPASGNPQTMLVNGSNFQN